MSGELLMLTEYLLLTSLFVIRYSLFFSIYLSQSSQSSRSTRSIFLLNWLLAIQFPSYFLIRYSLFVIRYSLFFSALCLRFHMYSKPRLIMIQSFLHILDQLVRIFIFIFQIHQCSALNLNEVQQGIKIFCIDD